MKSRKVIRYYCDFCKKSGGNKYWIKRHEESCTANPNRKCRMCSLIATIPSYSVSALTKMFPSRKDIEISEEKNQFSEIELVDQAIEKIRKENDGICPACILAVLRQNNFISSFNYKKEVEEMMKLVNEFWIIAF
jgi:hypothetical protein